MRSYISIPLLAAIGVNHVSGYHHYHGRHNHHLPKPHAEQLQAGDVNWLDRIPANMMVEIRTITTTVFEDCPSTETLDPTTTTIFAQLIHVPTNGVAMPAPAAPEVSKPSWVNAMPTNSMPTHALPTQVNVDKPVSGQDEQITIIEMTTTVTTTETAGASSSSAVTAPSSVNTSVETRPDVALSAPTAPAKLDAPAAPGRLSSLPQLPQELPQVLQDTPKDIVSELPLSALPLSALPHLPVDQILNPNEPPVPSNLDWTAVPQDGDFTFSGFGGRTKPSGTHLKYHGNVGIPWGSNIITVSPTEAHRYKYVARFTGSNTQPWTVTIWNKVGPDNKMDGWYSHSALSFILGPGETRYVAFDEDSEGAWGAAPGTRGLPVDHLGGFTSTWGEFSFGDGENEGWSGWDVSAIQAQIAGQRVQGMRICMADGNGCSVITPQARKVVNAYTEDQRHHDGIGGAAAPGPVRLVVDIDYRGEE